ncbi:hypothetical protein RRG08_003977 [Elysia crispata]|uniref:Uncharacterized protein n=1 Tax=Elysia crispata TaxID=231223 RepID=A0AAE1CMX1_9GAST|nr:hypothetical protein RRG08_003977 [Elysia crispata]
MHTPLTVLVLIFCFSKAVEPSCTPVREGNSTLTINSVSRTDPFNMEVKWTCDSCYVNSQTVCSKLEVYALAENPTCTVSENTESGDIKSVSVSCSTSKIYPRAKCRFYSRMDVSPESH